jgi:protein-L-isoaspartate(D-aspartate) O-methyltransferase
MNELRDEAADEQRARMVARQLRTRGIRDERVLQVMGEIPRELFVPEDRRRLAYADEALPIASGQTISQPYIVARMTELLAVAPGERVLEVGTGSGYQAAILAELGCRVTTIECEAGLAAAARERLEGLGYKRDRIDVRTGDGTQGLPDEAPWDGILVAAAAPEIPDPLREQLGEGRRLVIPVGSRQEQQLLVVERHGTEWREWSDGPCVFVPLIGEAGWEA